jgi:hypothetical protein
MQAEAIRAAITALRSAHDDLAACDVDTLTPEESACVLDDLETMGCQLPVQRHRLLAQLQKQTTPRELGAKSWRDVLMVRWRLSSIEANRRLSEAALLGPRQTLSGEPLEPILAATTAAQALGLITGEHVQVIRKGMTRIPGSANAGERVQIEVDWVRHAIGIGPKELGDTVARTLFLMDQDGPAPDDAERGRRRGVTKGPQHRDGMTRLTAELTPEAWAIWEALFAKFAAPGMCNPDDAHPCASGTPSQQQIDDDKRTLDQRRHDALAFVGRNAMDKAQLGQHNGLPTSIIVRTTLQDLESRAGVGVTGGGTVMPISDVIRLAAQANADHYLAVFDRATGSALDLFRARRTASVAQRIMLIARDGGCTKPVCTVPAYGTQVHHAARDWTHGGLTNVDELGLACGANNRMVGPDGWTTRINDMHEVEWIPPPHLDAGQARINYYHRPERLRPPPDDAWTPDLPTTPDAQVLDDPWAPDDTPVSTPDDVRIPADRRVLDDPWAPDESPVDGDPAAGVVQPVDSGETSNGDNATHESGGPEPPSGNAA